MLLLLLVVVLLRKGGACSHLQWMFPKAYETSFRLLQSEYSCVFDLPLQAQMLLLLRN